MYKDLTAQLRLFETVCRHSEKPDIADLVRCAWQAIEKLQTPQWIPVTERFPNLGVRALCKCRANIYEVLTWTAEGWEYDPQHIYMSGFVTHWMPLPSAPTEE